MTNLKITASVYGVHVVFVKDTVPETIETIPSAEDLRNPVQNFLALIFLRTHTSWDTLKHQWTFAL